ncbi:MAG: U32 family peptidase [Candidatus Omnitrophica bacterium]|nr:U32 family peptidase [Candidatus Omnitrophota bacterium]
MKNKPELLLPAGDLEKMRFAFAFGADAVYLGIPRFSLRARENGFKDLSQVAEAVAYAHKLGKKIYVTANIFAHNSKVDVFVKYVSEVLSLCRPDAWILSDPGLIMFMRDNFPSEVIHISVQSNVLNHASAKFWQKTGASRIILSREISIAEMKVIHDALPDLELESFVHGAVCIAYSGRCLISNYLTHRDSNQGVCTNSCRWQYKMTKTKHGDDYVPLKDEFFLEESERKGMLFPIDEDESGTYLMNAKDLCAIKRLNELRDAGISAFKVEGRSKTVYYVAMIARAYRRAIDDMAQDLPFNAEHMQDILATSSRGLNEGFLHGDPGASALEYDTSNSASLAFRFSGIVRGYDNDKKWLKIEPRNPIKINRMYELCTPGGTVPVVVKELFNDKCRPVADIHGGVDCCWLAYGKDPGAFAILREKLDVAAV